MFLLLKVRQLELSDRFGRCFTLETKSLCGAEKENSCKDCCSAQLAATVRKSSQKEPDYCPRMNNATKSGGCGVRELRDVPGNQTRRNPIRDSPESIRDVARRDGMTESGAPPDREVSDPLKQTEYTDFGRTASQFSRTSPEPQICE
jgi:hypothetical protein